MKKTGPRMAAMAAALLASAVALFALNTQTKPGVAQVEERLNILFVMTDDQPKDTLLVMPKVRERIVNRGANLTNAYVSESLCCRRAPRC